MQHVSGRLDEYRARRVGVYGPRPVEGADDGNDPWVTADGNDHAEAPGDDGGRP